MKGKDHGGAKAIFYIPVPRPGSNVVNREVGGRLTSQRATDRLSALL